MQQEALKEAGCRYEIYAFSRAKTALAIVAHPVRRFFQFQFRKDSIRKLKAHVQQQQDTPVAN